MLFIMDYTAFATAAGSAINSLVGSASNANLNETNRHWQAEQSALNYQRQRELLKDSPALQKQGLINAGFSPAALGNYSGPSANVSSASAPNASSPEFVPMDSRVFLDAFLAKKQGEVADSTVDKNEAEANKANEEAGVVAPLAAAQIAKLKASTNLDESSINKIAAEIPVLNNQADYWKYMSQVENIVAEKSKATYQNEVEAMQSQYKLSKAQAEEAMKYVEKMAKASFELVSSQVYNNRAQGSAALSNATTNRLEYDLDTLRVNLQKMGVDADVALKGAQAAYQDALKGAVPSQIAANKASAKQAKAAASNQRAQAKHHDAQRRNIPFDNMIKGANTFINGVNAAGGVVGRAIPFLL